MKTQLKDRNHFQQEMKRLKESGKSFVAVGIPDGTPRTGDGMSMAEVAAVNEFGSEDGRIPERSFLRATLDERRKEIINVQAIAFKKLAEGKMTTEVALGTIGQWVASAVKARIRKGPFQENAPVTIRAKGSSKPLIDTGQLLAAVTHAVYMNKDRPKK